MRNEQLIMLLEEMVKDEAKAPNDYRKIINLMTNNTDRKRLLKVLRDEERHYKIDRQILNKEKRRK